MDLYTLTDQFLSKDSIDKYVSAIWTERYFEAGDVQLVVPATSENIEKLADGTFLALRGSKEVMLLETQSIEDNLMTIVGATLPAFLSNRFVWFRNPDWISSQPTEPKIVDYTDDTRTTGAFLADVVTKMIITPIPMVGTGFVGVTPVNLDWAFEVIPHLEIGAIDDTGGPKRITIPIGPLYDGIQQIAQKDGLGFTMYLESATIEAGYVLKFDTYRGKDRTVDGGFPLVRLTTDMDSLSELKEVRSRANYKNVVYVWYKGIISTHYAEPELPKPEGFERRVLVTDAEGEPVGHKFVARFYRPGYVRVGDGYVGTTVSAGDLPAFREQNAKDALANHNYIQAIDGQTHPNNDYKFGADYGLGDIIELQGVTGAISKARITEYIRSEDPTGERAYPTISVI